MEEPITYPIRISLPYTLTRKTGVALLFIAAAGASIFYLVSLPVKDQQPEISIPYFLWLPRWLIDIFLGSAFCGLLAFMVLGIRKNMVGILKIYSNRLDINSPKFEKSINYSELKRINFISDSLAFRTYSIEFIYRDLRFTRVKAQSEAEFREIFDKLCELAPLDLELDITPIESSDAFDR